MALTLDEASRIVDGAIIEARKRNVVISATVCNGDGRLIALKRMDGAEAETNLGSIGKAIAAASYGRPSDAVEGSEDFPLRTGWVIGEGLPLDHRRGGLPIIRNGEVKGACGVDGSGSGEQDESCARAGLGAMVCRDGG
jgi:uncharacterized protein GlcG (DUF336 family)